MNTNIIYLEDRISKLIFSDNGRTIHFEYNLQEGQHKVVAHTYNSKNRETFLLKTETGTSYEECLNKIYTYIESIQKSDNSYTIVWSRKGKSEINKSYFMGEDIIEVIKKFFNGKDVNQYLVYEIKMNPTS